MAQGTLDITLNGAAETVSSGATMVDLLTTIGLPSEGVAVAVNGAVVPRALHALTAIENGDRIEVIRAVGGG